MPEEKQELIKIEAIQLLNVHQLSTMYYYLVKNDPNFQFIDLKQKNQNNQKTTMSQDEPKELYWGIVLNDPIARLIGYVHLEPTQMTICPGSKINIYIDPEYHHCFFEYKIFILFQKNPKFWNRMLWYFNPKRILFHPWTMGPKIKSGQNQTLYSYFYFTYHQCQKCFYQLCYLNRLTQLPEIKTNNDKIANLAEGQTYQLSAGEITERRQEYETFQPRKSDLLCRFIVRSEDRGIKRDIDAYRQFLTNGYVVKIDQEILDRLIEEGITDCNKYDKKGLIDISFHFDMSFPVCQNEARCNLFMPNYESMLFTKKEEQKERDAVRNMLYKGLAHMDYLFAKTQITIDYCQKLKNEHNFKYKIVYTKHTSIVSPIHLMVDIPRDNVSWLHAAGQSNWKQTDTVLDAWLGHPEWPHLVVTCGGTCLTNDFLQEKLNRYPNYRYAKNVTILEKVDDIDRLTYQFFNHVCPSIVEGYGQYINQARAYGCFIVTSDYPPMNELITKESGYLIPCSKLEDKPRTLDIKMCLINTEDFSNHMKMVFQIPLKTRIERARKVFDKYQEDTQYFYKSINQVLKEVESKIAST